MNPIPAFSRRHYLAEEEEDDHRLESSVKTNKKSSSGSNLMWSSAHHFLGKCSLCGRRIDPKKDVYMYMGDTAFCTQECREQRIEEDEEAKKRIKIKGSKATDSASLKRERKKAACNFYGVPTGPMAAV